MKLLLEFPGVDGSWQELTRDSREGSRQEMAGKGLDRRYLEMVLEPLGSNSKAWCSNLVHCRYTAGTWTK